MTNTLIAQSTPVLSIIWIALPFFIGFVIYLLPKFARWLAVVIALLSASYALQIFLTGSPDGQLIQLLDNFGVTLIVDQLSGFFILTNALVTIAVILYCWQTNKKAFFYMQIVILHGSVNAAFICADFISLYVALEVISIAAFLLIAYPRTDKSIWVGLRYLFVSNTAMLFYLVGAILVYKANNSFQFDGLINSPPEAIALIFLGLLAKGGTFVSGLWLPLTHSESETPVSAMLSGVVVKAGVFPLVRCALMMEEIEPVVKIFGVGTALLGVGYAIFAADTKRTLAFSTVSQLGFVLAAPVAAGFYALTHGLVKSVLFLIAGFLPSRNFQELKEQGIDPKIWLPLIIASFSISGFPLLSGFGSKVLTTKNLLPWQVMAMNVAAVGTAITFAKFVFLPRSKPVLSHDDRVKTGEETKKLGSGGKKIPSGLWRAIVILLGGLIVANGIYYEAYTVANITKSLVIIAIGWLAHLLIFQKLMLKLPRAVEKFEHLIGVMSLMLILVFWMVRI
ncbi:cation:proton antiporter [Pleurocapsa sp. PCC 7319]|uniref:cation:proton antiporter n=1 Tax=Pleurocapsa sp. PCC 7319 TaxID=118161 RepID=UPI000347B81D|nr:cation:proton antiporter [Pleurocapsa sp. PCC 7319]